MWDDTMGMPSVKSRLVEYSTGQMGWLIAKEKQKNGAEA